jgi:hypothetical protein
MRLPGTFWRHQQLLLLVLNEVEDDNDNPERFYALFDEDGRRRGNWRGGKGSHLHCH